jgi:hypothetical protein
MNIEQLTDDEQLALAGLLVRVAQADGSVSSREIQEIAAVGEETGDSLLFNAAFQYAEIRFTNDRKAIEFAKIAVRRKPAQSIILTVLGDLAGSDGVHGSERQFVDGLREAWR